MSIPTPEEYDVLVMWPPGTRGEAHERDLVRTLHALCVENGLGRVAQMVAAMEDLWRRPERRPSYELAKRQMVKDLAGACAEADKRAKAGTL